MQGVMKPTLFHYGALGAAIACELVGTTLLQKSEQFTRFAPTLFMVLFFAGSFFFLSHALKAIPIGIAYAVWAGVGVVLTAFIGVAVFRQTLDVAAIAGIAMIAGGVVVVNAFSNSAMH